MGAYSIKVNDIRDLLAKNLKQKRKSLGLTQSELAEKADISIRYYQSIEKDKTTWPQPEKLQSIADALNVKIEELFQAEEPPKNPIEDILAMLLAADEGKKAQVRAILKGGQLKELSRSKNSAKATSKT